MPAISNPQKVLLALLFLAIVALNAGSSGGIRFGGDEEGGSGFGGTGRMPTGGSGLGGTGLKPFLGDSGEVRIQYEPEAILIADQIADEDIKRIPKATVVLPPAAVVTIPGFAAEKSAEIAITDAIQLQLQRDAVIYERIRESVEGYYPPEVDSLGSRILAPGPATEQSAAPDPLNEMSVAAAAFTQPTPAPAADESHDADSAPNPATLTWAELARYLASNDPVRATDGVTVAEATKVSAATQRPNRIRRPELPPVQRGRIIQRPAILPPRVQPLQF